MRVSKLPRLWKLTFTHKLTFVAVFWIKRLFIIFTFWFTLFRKKWLLKAIISQGHSAGRGVEGGPGSFFSCCHASTIFVSLKVHIPPDDTFSAERKTCYLLGKFGIRFSCNISCICVNTDRIIEEKNGIIWWYICGICRNAGRIWYWGAEWPCNLQKRELWQSLAHFQSPVLSTFGQSRIGDKF